MEITARDLFLGITLPLLLGITLPLVGLIVSFLFVYVKIAGSLVHIRGDTSRLPDIQIEVARLAGTMQAEKGHQSVSFKLPKSGLEAVVHVRD